MSQCAGVVQDAIHCATAMIVKTTATVIAYRSRGVNAPRTPRSSEATDIVVGLSRAAASLQCGAMYPLAGLTDISTRS